jgi:predicted O-methyltransferase YrrM
MHFLKRFAKSLLRPCLTLWAHFPLRRMAHQPEKTSKMLAEALRKTIGFQSTPEEQTWIDAIEALRAELEHSKEPIEVVDYGAGFPNQPRSKEEMEQGVTRHTTIGTMSGASRDRLWLQLLFHLMRAFKPNTSIEMGSALGLSAAYESAALRLNQAGQLIILEGAHSLAQQTAKNLSGLGFDNVCVVEGRFVDTLGRVLEDHPSIDYAFVDGHHDGDATIAYFEKIYPHLSETAVLVFDDIFSYKSMRKAWRTLEADQRICISVDLLLVGVCIVKSNSSTKQVYKIPMA